MASIDTAGRAPAGAARALAAPLLSAVDRIAGLDLSDRWGIVGLAAVFLLLRLPWLWTGYGAETDAYRVALSGLHLWRDGEYLPSRLPGYPVHELLMAPLVRFGGSIATNAATALAALVATLILLRIAREVREPSPGLVAIAFAFTPFLLVNSVETKDYFWALTFMLASYLAAIRERPLLAGFLLGLGVGSRITTATFALPLLLLFVDRHAWQQGVRFGGALIVTAFIVFLPVTLQYGTAFFNYADSRISPDIVIRSIGQYSIGAFGAFAVVIALAFSWRSVARLPAMAWADVHVRIWLLTVVLYAGIFLRLPIDIAYLIPIYPFCYLLLGKVLNRYLFAAVVAVILLSGFIDLDISAMHNLNLRTFVQTARPCRSCAELFHDWHARERYINYATKLGAEPVPPHSVVLTGGVFPDFAVINWRRLHYGVIDRYRGSVSILSDDGVMRDTEHDVLYLASPDRPQVIDRLRQEGYRFYKADPSGPDWQPQLTPVE